MKFVSILKRAFAPFFVISALLCLLQASRYIDFFFWWLGLCLLVVLARQQQERLSLTWINAALVGFCLLLLINALYLNPAYYAGGIYFPATLLIAFIAASCRSVWLTQTGFKIFCAVIGLIAVWALVQWLTGWGFLGRKSARAQALFATPNILATALNLGLMPVLSYYLLGRGGRGVYGLTLLLFAGLLTTQSRGGYVGLLSGVLFLVTLVGKAEVVAHWRRYRRVAVGFLSVLGFFKLYAWLGLASWSTDAVFATLMYGDTSDRWEIYQVAWKGLAEHLWLGIGYYNFGYYFEAHKVPPFLDRRIIFVHNDYLEFALETGLLGLGLFLLLIVAVYGQLFKFRQQAMAGQRLPLILSAAAITSMLAHALVDYPFYIPVLMAVFGAYLGIINQQLIDMGATHWQLPKMSMQYFLGLRSGFIGNALVMGLLAWLGLPAFALVAANYSSYRLLAGDAQQALLWSGVARTLQPRTAGYYWKEGVIWRDQGVAQNRPDLLEKSNVIFSKGLEVNPFEVNNLLEKTALHRQYGTMLKQPASHQDIMTLINQAKSLQPHPDVVQMEYVRCLDFVGEHAKAIEQAKVLALKRPQFKAAQRLFESVSHE
ncbi:O-antigen ligase family protein [Methylobacter tundripaludum]|uniref:O-antigen polymerase n=1 Tax=Methylobacter tundripaludum (strain ATCC BAA-1195 / DSM 17260 / SV96) TaxID=697282 RepID=G3IYP4_METTV|nr:O-antigen ligase family protein [Methylobacter tundripaludum]EGW20092.1 O-antigen polymerase [Methylobacter tundripaludum SV96]